MADKVKFITCEQDLIDLMNKWVNGEIESGKEIDEEEESETAEFHLKK